MSPSHMPDEELVEKLQELMRKGEAETAPARKLANEIFKRYYNYVVNFCRYYGLRKQDAEDTAQDAFVKMYKHLLSFKSGKKFKPWFFTLVFNKVRDKHNEIKKTAFRDLETIQDIASNEHEKLSENLQIREYIHGIINKMPEKLKQVLVMKLFGEMDFEEIALVMGVSSRQIRTRLDQAMAHLKNEVGDEYEF